MDLKSIKATIGLAEVVRAAGVDLRQRGDRWRAACPLHEENTASFFIYPDGRFHCFGCGAHGDAIDFVRKFYSTDFRGALRILGIERKAITKADRQRIERHRRQRELRRQFDEWRRRTIDEISLLVRSTYLASLSIKTIDDAVIFRDLAKWEFFLEILAAGNDEDRLNLYREARRHGRTFID